MTLSIKEKRIVWIVFGFYMTIMCVAMYCHEPWGDELHVWNIAKASGRLGELLYNKRYEGHPPVWYIVLWITTKFTHNPVYMQVVHSIVAGIVVFTLLFKSPLPLSTKILIPFGYFFLYEYAVISRDYATGVLSAFLICIVLRRKFKYKHILYYMLLLVLSNTHLLGLLMAGSLHLYYLVHSFEKKERFSIIILHILAGAIVFLPAVYFITPPGDSELSVASWIERWSKTQLFSDVQVPMRAFIPLPAWWIYNFWNTQFLIQLQAQIGPLKILNVLINAALIILGAYILKQDKKSLLFFITNVLLTFVIGLIYPMVTERYAGFIFIGFIVACWLHYLEKPITASKTRVVNALLFVQLFAGIFVVYKDIVLPFSNFYRVKKMISGLNAGEMVVSDYWASIGFNAYTDKPVYCVDMQESIYFMLWGSKMTEAHKFPTRYYRGINNLFVKERIKRTYLLSTNTMQELFKTDAKLFSSFKIQLIDKADGAIEKWSNLYIYEISAL